VKSDDVAGRTKVYEAIVRRATTRSRRGIPEHFNVLVKEMRSLGLNVDLHNSKLPPRSADGTAGRRPSRAVAHAQGRAPDGPRLPRRHHASRPERPRYSRGATPARDTDGRHQPAQCLRRRP